MTTIDGGTDHTDPALRALLNQAVDGAAPVVPIESIARRVRRQRWTRAARTGAGTLVAVAAAGALLTVLPGGPGPNTTVPSEPPAPPSTTGAVSSLWVSIAIAVGVTLAVGAALIRGRTPSPGRRAIAFGAAQSLTGALTVIACAPLAGIEIGTGWYHRVVLYSAWPLLLGVLLLRDSRAPRNVAQQGSWGLGPGLLGTVPGTQIALGIAAFVGATGQSAPSGYPTTMGVSALVFTAILLVRTWLSGPDDGSSRPADLRTAIRTGIRPVVATALLTLASYLAVGVTVLGAASSGAPRVMIFLGGLVVVFAVIGGIALALRRGLRAALIDLAPGLGLAATLGVLTWGLARGFSGSAMVLVAALGVLVLPLIVTALAARETTDPAGRVVTG